AYRDIGLTPAQIDEAKAYRRDVAARNDYAVYRKYFKRDMHSSMVNNLARIGLLTERVRPRLAALRLQLPAAAARGGAARRAPPQRGGGRPRARPRAARLRHRRADPPPRPQPMDGAPERAQREAIGHPVLHPGARERPRLVPRRTFHEPVPGLPAREGTAH